MKSITLSHPWPFCVCCLGKRIVNRTWTPKRLKVGDRFAIHGGKVPTGHDLATVKLTYEAIEKDHGRANGDITLHDIIMPGIVAIATFGGITDGRGECDCGRIEHGRCHSACPSQRVDPWFDTLTPGNRGWLLRDVVVLPTPIPCKGAQGLWAVPDDVLRQIGEL